MSAAAVHAQLREAVADPDGQKHVMRWRREGAEHLTDAREPAEHEDGQQRCGRVADAAQRQPVRQGNAVAVDAMDAPLEVEDDTKRPDVENVVGHVSQRSTSTATRWRASRCPARTRTRPPGPRATR